MADTVLTYHNANGLGAPGAGRGYLRDVALVMSDIHALSETSWDEAQVKTLTEAMQNGGHRLWANTAKTRSVAKSGTAILARSTVAPCKGDGELWSKPDGKALAVALTAQGQPVVLLAAHLPHTDPERVSFLPGRWRTGWRRRSPPTSSRPTERPGAEPYTCGPGISTSRATPRWTTSHPSQPRPLKW